MKIFEEKFFLDRDNFRNWLNKSHGTSSGIWLIYYKKHTQKPSIIYEEAVQEALCFGWIDSTVQRIDDEKYKQKFTPRNDKSEWSKLNKERVKKLIKQKKMTHHGLVKIDIAKKNGMWDKLSSGDVIYVMPEIFKKELNKNKSAKVFFEKLSPSHKKHFIRWIATAKRDETKFKRITEAIIMLSENKKLGMK